MKSAVALAHSPSKSGRANCDLSSGETNCPDKPLARVTEDGRWQLLEDHLRGVSELAASFAEEFGCPGWARLAGLWHDMGKYSEEFQKYIRSSSGLNGQVEMKPGRVDHSTCGAKKACEKFNGPGLVLAYVIAGHHAGLPDWETESSGMSGLGQRLRKLIPLSRPPDSLLSQAIPSERPRPGADLSMWIRMLFSCVVDADCLDSEAFDKPAKARLREGYPSLEELLPMFEDFMRDKQASSDKTAVNLIRAAVLRQCILKACEQPAIFSLTVPTGGGKTLSSMAFALNHALKHGKRRIIYVIPYTSIIEQTADQFREIFGNAVLEHHSNIEIPETEDEAFRKSQLASENWDAPIVVTTSVQFFESLYASRTSRCRKLHNIVNSIVILDEVQLLPPDLLNPILKALSELHKNYGVTLLLSTATQPVFAPMRTLDFDFPGLPGMTEIVNDPGLLHEQLKRVEVHVPQDLNKELPWQELAAELSKHPTVLCVVSRRDDCRKLHSLMPEGTIHLSALMCGAHRSKVIASIKKRLKDGVPTRVISTQLVEAGVDFDFPVVYRALAGLDSIAQAAGRCNREGLLKDGKGLLKEGNVVVFVPESETPPDLLRQAADIGRRLLADSVADPLAPQRFAAFFKELYWLHGDRLDAKGILKDLASDPKGHYSFRTAAGKFHVIDESLYAPVIVRFEEGDKLLAVLTKSGPERWLMRKLQRYVVNIPKYILGKLMQTGEVEEPFPGIYAQSVLGRYDEATGLVCDRKGFSPDDLVI